MYDVHPVRALGSSYVFGVLVGNVLFLPLTNVLFFASVVGGLIFGLPLLFVAFLTLIAFRRHIETHLFTWCVAAPIVVTVGWVAFEQYAIFARQGLGLERYFAEPVASMRAALAFTCAAVASAKFYRMTKLV